MRNTLKIVVSHANRPVKFVCDRLMGEDHSMRTRMITGVIFMVVGVMIAKFEHHFQSDVLKSGCDGMGYLIHGMGGAPFIDYIKKMIS